MPMIRAMSMPVVMEQMTDPGELAMALSQEERFQRNSEWLQAHVAEVYSRHRGRCICVAGQQLFVGDTPEAAIALAIAAHPDDDGRLLRYIPRERMARVYANRRTLAAV